MASPNRFMLNLDKIGFVVAAFASLCLLDFDPLVTIVNSVRLGLLLNHTFLAVLLVAALLAGALGLGRSFMTHHSPWPVFLHLGGGILLVVFLLVNFQPMLGWVGLMVVSLAAFVDISRKRA